MYNPFRRQQSFNDFARIVFKPILCLFVVYDVVNVDKVLNVVLWLSVLFAVVFVSESQRPVYSDAEEIRTFAKDLKFF